jgi:hypothetical protein
MAIMDKKENTYRNIGETITFNSDRTPQEVDECEHSWERHEAGDGFYEPAKRCSKCGSVRLPKERKESTT